MWYIVWYSKGDDIIRYIMEFVTHIRMETCRDKASLYV